jgi:hypothetical protein
MKEGHHRSGERDEWSRSIFISWRGTRQSARSISMSVHRMLMISLVRAQVRTVCSSIRALMLSMPASYCMNAGGSS